MDDNQTIAETAGTLAFDAEAPPQLIAQFMNYGAASSGVVNVVYIAHDTKTNKIDLQLMLPTGSSTLVAGDVVAPADLPPTDTQTQTLLYLDLTPLKLTSAAWQLLAPQADGWHCAVYASDHQIGMSPSVDGTVLAAGRPISIHLHGLQLDAAPPSPTTQLTASYYNVPGVTTDQIPLPANFSVSAQNPPGGNADLTRDLAVTLEANVVVNSVGATTLLDNTLTLEFSRTSQGVAVPAGPDTRFTVSFVYGKAKDEYGYGALTTVAEATAIKLVKGDNVDQWIPKRHTDHESPYWTLRPPAGADIGADAVSSWSFTDIATTYQPGPTIMIVKYSGLRGYEDGAYSLILNKIGHVHIRSLSVGPSPTYLQDGKATVTVSWQVDYARALALTQYGEKTTTIDVTSQNSVKPVLDTESTSFTLQANGRSSPANVEYANRTAIALPEIKSFLGAPTEIYAGATSHEVELSWEVQTTGKVELKNSLGQSFGRDFDATGSATVTVTQPQAIWVASVLAGGFTDARHTLIVDAFRPVAAKWHPGVDTWAATAAPSAPFVVLACDSDGGVIALDTVRASKIATLPMDVPRSFAFSSDGSLMATVCYATVWLHEVAIADGLPQFTMLDKLSLPGGEGNAVVFGSDNSTVYVAAGDVRGSVVVATKGKAGYAVTQQAPVGDAPAALALDPSASRLYVANTGDDTVSVFDIGMHGSLITREPVLLSTGGESIGPSGLAVTPNGATLLVACEDLDAVLAIPTANPTAGGRQKLPVGGAPQGVSVTPGGAYAFVVNSDYSVSLLDVSSGPPNCAVLPPIPIGHRYPGPGSVSADGLTLLVSDTDSSSVGLGVITLEIYSLESVVDTVGGAPNDVVVAPDAKSALVWHGALGVCHYAIDTQVTTEILSDITPLVCVFGPSADVAGTSYIAWAIDTSGRQLHLVHFDGGSPPVETAVDLPGPATAKGLALSSDGATVFLVMADGSQSTIVIGSVTSGAWETWQSLELFGDEALGDTAGVTVTPDGSHVFIIDTAHDRFRVAVRDETGRYALSTAALPITTPRSVAVLPDSTKAYVCESTHPDRITIVDIPTLTATPVSVMDDDVNLGKLVASPDGRRLLAADANAAALCVIDPQSLRFLQTIPLAKDPKQAQGASSIAIAPDGSRIFVTNTTSGTMSVLRQNAMGAD